VPFEIKYVYGRLLSENDVNARSFKISFINLLFVLYERFFDRFLSLCAKLFIAISYILIDLSEMSII